MEMRVGTGNEISLKKRPTAAPKKILGIGSKSQNANPSKVKHPEKREKRKGGTPIKKVKARILRVVKKSEEVVLAFDKEALAQKHPTMVATKADSKWKSLSKGKKSIAIPSSKELVILKRFRFNRST